MTQDLAGLEETGPIDYLVVAFPHAHFTGEAFPLLVDLVERGIIRILDLTFIQKAEDGTVSGLELTELADGGVDLTIFEGASSGLLGDDDLAEAANALAPGTPPGCSCTRTCGPPRSRSRCGAPVASSSPADASRCRRSSLRWTPSNPSPETPRRSYRCQD